MFLFYLVLFMWHSVYKYSVMHSSWYTCQQLSLEQEISVHNYRWQRYTLYTNVYNLILGIYSMHCVPTYMDNVHPVFTG